VDASTLHTLTLRKEVRVKSRWHGNGVRAGCLTVAFVTTAAADQIVPRTTISQLPSPLASPWRVARVAMMWRKNQFDEKTAWRCRGWKFDPRESGAFSAFVFGTDLLAAALLLWIFRIPQLVILLSLSRSWVQRTWDRSAVLSVLRR